MSRTTRLFAVVLLLAALTFTGSAQSDATVCEVERLVATTTQTTANDKYECTNFQVQARLRRIDPYNGNYVYFYGKWANLKSVAASTYGYGDSSVNGRNQARYRITSTGYVSPWYG